MHKVRVNNGNIRFLAFIKSPIYIYLDEKPNLYVIENDDYNKKKKINLSLSVHSYYKSDTLTCRFYMFSYHCNAEEVSSFKFIVELDGIEYDTTYWCMPVAVFNNNIKSYVRENVKLSLKDNNTIVTEIINREDIDELEETNSKLFVDNIEVYDLREESLQYRKQHRIWLYYDLYTVEKDNGYYQFINDFKHDDGVERYYIYDKEITEIQHLFTDEQRRHLVRFGSMIHKLLYLSAEKVLTAFYGFSTISPFITEDEESNFLDIIKFETIYLQHGVLHANLKLKNHVERCRADKIVISSYFEKENYINNYGYEENDLICTGMARYNHIDRSKKAKNRILFAPSWRQYLTSVQSGAKWEVLEGKITASDYYKKIVEMLTSSRLNEILESNNLYLDFKLHPIIKDAKHLFPIESNRVCFAADNVDLEDYQVFMTDFSSFVFDFVYLNRPVIYFVPDMDQFKSGMNHYRELDLPFEKAFGKLNLEADDAINELERIINNNFSVDKIYKERMESFFFDWTNSAEGLYKYLIEE